MTKKRSTKKKSNAGAKCKTGSSANQDQELAESAQSRASNFDDLPTALQQQLDELAKDKYGRTLLKHTHNPKNAERREGYTTTDMSRIECDPSKPMHEDIPPDQLIATVIPRVGVERDGYTECIIPNIVRKRILTTPGFPAPVPRSAVDPVYKIVQVPGKGLGMAATRDIEARGLVLAERPLKITPVNLPGQQLIKSLPEHYTLGDFIIAQLQESERFLETFTFDLMEEEKKKAFFLALHDANTKDGSGPIVGRLRTNGSGIGELYGGASEEERGNPTKVLKGTFEVGSRVQS